MRLENPRGIHGYFPKTIYEAESVLTTPLRVFYSYAPSDSSQQINLEKHLSALGHRGLISSWHNRTILPGADWKQEIDEHLDTADIILLLISPDFMASDYCYGIEMQRAFERYKSKDAHVITIIVRPVLLEGTPVEQLPILPSNGKPIATWRPQDEGFRVTAKEIAQIVKDLLCHKLEAAGRAHYLAGRYKEATRVFEHILDLDHENVVALNGLGFILLYDKNEAYFKGKRRDKTAMDYFQIVLTHDSNNASACYGIGCALLESKRYEQALLAFEDALKINPSNVDYYISKSITLLHLNDPQEALSTCERSLRIDPDNAAALNTMGDIFDALHRYGEALDAYNKAIDAYTKFLHLNPDNAGYYACKGNLLRRLKCFDEALEAYNKALKINPNNADYYTDKGNILRELKRYEEALGTCERALRFGPDNVYANFLKFTILIQLERFQEALDTANEIASRVPHDGHFYGMKGHAFLELGAHDQVLIVWDRVLHLDPSNATAHEGKGNIFDSVGRYDEALNSYNEALRLNPSKTDVYKRKGDTLCRLKRYDEALAAYDEALRLDPNDASAHSTKGLILNTLKRSREALTSLDEALRLDPKNTDIRRLRDSVHRDLVNSGQTP